MNILGCLLLCIYHTQYIDDDFSVHTTHTETTKHKYYAWCMGLRDGEEDDGGGDEEEDVDVHAALLPHDYGPPRDERPRASSVGWYPIISASTPISAQGSSAVQTCASRGTRLHGCRLRVDALSALLSASVYVAVCRVLYTHSHVHVFEHVHNIYVYSNTNIHTQTDASAGPPHVPHRTTIQQCSRFYPQPKCGNV